MFYFFFQAKDGIRDGRVTGVQTCALPIFWNISVMFAHHLRVQVWRAGMWSTAGSEIQAAPGLERSEERRVGKESNFWWLPDICMKTFFMRVTVGSRPAESDSLMAPSTNVK